jgi:hypothetical protein
MALGSLTGVAALAAATVIVAVLVYRIYFSPLARIPGPTWAALTGYYELYYDLFQGARFPWVIQSLHAKYGKVPTKRLPRIKRANHTPFRSYHPHLPP